ncbi:MAG TPA: prepilin-type N-terminal cleavage/methylation domain-containing protein, partial [Candidatus Saccharimonadia bacterium]|nr:prepilin-type N-terminal cleavage/methylation domain-containing protein [Candidatus Saccharimonadia bacterium]
MHAHRGGFTLVEMLVVVTIVGILISVSAAGLSGAIQAMSLTNSGGKLTQVMEAARQRSMTGNVMTAVILVTKAGQNGDGRAFTIAECPPGGPWVQIREWEMLPDGIVIDLDAGTDNASFLANTPEKFPFNNGQSGSPVKYNGFSLPAGTYAARIFLPGGGLLNPNEAAVLQVVHGTVEGGRVIYHHRNPSGKPANYYRVALLGATGKTKVERPE